MYFWKYNICSSKLDVQETDFCLSQFHRVLTPDLLDIVIEVPRSNSNNVQPKHASMQETDATRISKPRPRKSKEDKRLIS